MQSTINHMNTKAIKAGIVLVYNDGREGHQDAACEVLGVSDKGMLVQFTDRADTTRISFNDAAWMNHLTIKG